MKKRKGFVTNSSSSSFVLILNGSSSDSVIKNTDELREYFMEIGFYGGVAEMLEDYQQEYDKYIRLLEEGRQLYFGDMENDATESFQAAMDALGFDVQWGET